MHFKAQEEPLAMSFRFSRFSYDKQQPHLICKEHNLLLFQAYLHKQNGTGTVDLNQFSALPAVTQLFVFESLERRGRSFLYSSGTKGGRGAQQLYQGGGRMGRGGESAFHRGRWNSVQGMRVSGMATESGVVVGQAGAGALVVLLLLSGESCSHKKAGITRGSASQT